MRSRLDVYWIEIRRDGIFTSDLKDKVSFESGSSR